MIKLSSKEWGIITQALRHYLIAHMKCVNSDKLLCPEHRRTEVLKKEKEEIEDAMARVLKLRFEKEVIINE